MPVNLPVLLINLKTATEELQQRIATVALSGGFGDFSPKECKERGDQHEDFRTNIEEWKNSNPHPKKEEKKLLAEAEKHLQQFNELLEKIPAASELARKGSADNREWLEECIPARQKEIERLQEKIAKLEKQQNGENPLADGMLAKQVKEEQAKLDREIKLLEKDQASLNVLTASGTHTLSTRGFDAMRELASTQPQSQEEKERPAPQIKHEV